MPAKSQTVHDYKPCTIGRQSHTFSFPTPYVIVSDITHTLQNGNCVRACTRFLSVNHLGLWCISQTFVFYQPCVRVP